MTGIQLSVNWAVAQAAEALAASSNRAERDAGCSLRCCEAVGLDRLPEGKRETDTQGVRVALRFYCEADRATVGTARKEVALAIGQAMGLWRGAVQLDLKQLKDKTSQDKMEDLDQDNGTWLGLKRPYQRGGTGLRLDRYLTAEVLEALEAKSGNSAWRTLAKRPAEVRILLRRLRYRLGQDFGAEGAQLNYAFWTTATTERWASQENHLLNYLLHTLSHWSTVLEGGNADPASSLDVGYWGEVDTERDQLSLRQMTTKSGSTALDVVRGVLDHAGAQIHHGDPILVSSNTTTNTTDPLLAFVSRLERVLHRPERLSGVDVLLIHRGGGVNPTPEDPRWTPTNVSDLRRREFLDLCLAVRDLGVEVVVALAHANVSVLDWDDRKEAHMPLGIFEATTPTAGAAWILQEHINTRRVDTGLIYSQSRAT